MTDTVAFIGLGAMGAPMASNLIDAGFTLRAFNRNPARAKALADRGAIVCTSIAEAVRGARFVVSMVSDDQATADVMLSPGGVIAQASAGTIILDASTNTPTMTAEVARAAQAAGLRHLDTPVSGSTGQARNRELVFMVGGDATTLEEARPVLAAMGRLTVHAGASGAGATIKLVNNMISGSMNAALAEAMSIVKAAGIDEATAQQILGEGAAASRLTKAKMPKMLTGEFSPQFQLGLMEKDLRYFLALAQQVDRPAPICSLVQSQFQAARRAGLGGLDVSAIYLQATGERP
jgi:2-hydroxy-3-oxopropionate reductase